MIHISISNLFKLSQKCYFKPKVQHGCDVIVSGMTPESLIEPDATSSPVKSVRATRGKNTKDPDSRSNKFRVLKKKDILSQIIITHKKK